MNFQKHKICVPRFIAQSRCSDTFGRVGITLSSSHLCALSEVGDTCSGDSGGSLIRWQINCETQSNYNKTSEKMEENMKW